MLSEERAKEYSAELVALKEQLVDTVAMLEALRKEKTTLQAQGQQVCVRLNLYLHIYIYLYLSIYLSRKRCYICTDAARRRASKQSRARARCKSERKVQGGRGAQGPATAGCHGERGVSVRARVRACVRACAYVYQVRLSECACMYLTCVYAGVAGEAGDGTGRAAGGKDGCCRCVASCCAVGRRGTGVFVSPSLCFWLCLCLAVSVSCVSGLCLIEFTPMIHPDVCMYIRIYV